jgi:AraC-like DNA-binding protein
MQEHPASTAEIPVRLTLVQGELEDALLHQIRAVVQERLPEGRPSKAFVARTLGVSVRTLHRRLAARGTTLDRIVREARARRTFELLANPGVGMYSVAIAAGYRGSASFYRAFRAWTGTTPAAYRAGCLAETRA